jgi:AraC-like DNA-binding protein
LLSNAARFTVEGHVTLRAAHSEDELHIMVEDTGPGIEPPSGTPGFPGGAPQTLSANLPAGVTTAAFVESVRAQHGAGLGLQVAHHLVALHGGTLAIFSRPGHGTLFEVRLPLCAGKERPPLEAAAVPAAPETGELLLQACLRRATSLSRALAAYVAENYAAPVSREEISAALKVSPNYLSRVFRQDTGLTPWQYLSQFRVVQAQKLLLTTELSVTEVAQRVGFSDPAYFVRVFHKETGRAPLQYRKSAK